jgi:MacB-like protein
MSRKEPGIHNRGRRVAGHRGRRQLRHLQLCRCAIAAAASGCQAGRDHDRGVDEQPRVAQSDGARVVVAGLRGRPRSRQQLRGPCRVFVQHRRLCQRFEDDAEAENGHGRHRQHVQPDGCRALGHTLWEQEFASDPSVLGRSVHINGHAFTVIGVAPSEFTGMNQFVRSDFFVPLMMSAPIVHTSMAESYV